MMPEQLNAIETRCNAATPGPWYQVVPPYGDGTWVNAGSDDAYRGFPICEGTEWDACAPESVPDGYDAQANMAFIAHARTDIPALIAAVREEQKNNLLLVMALTAIARDNNYKCQCGEEPYTDGELCPACFAINVLHNLRKEP